MSYWFLSSPYRLYPLGLDAAFKLAIDAAGLLTRAGVPVYSPIVHSHPMAMQCGMDAFSDIWLTTEAPKRHMACGMILLMADSWLDSAGMKAELAEFRAYRKPVLEMEVGIVPGALLE